MKNNMTEKDLNSNSNRVFSAAELLQMPQHSNLIAEVFAHITNILIFHNLHWFFCVNWSKKENAFYNLQMWFCSTYPAEKRSQHWMNSAGIQQEKHLQKHHSLNHYGRCTPTHMHRFFWQPWDRFSTIITPPDLSSVGGSTTHQI